MLLVLSCWEMSVPTNVCVNCRSATYLSSVYSTSIAHSASPATAALLYHSSLDVRLPFTAAAAITAYLQLYLLAGSGSMSSHSSMNSAAVTTSGFGLQQLLGPNCQANVVPPMGLIAPDKLQALCRLFKYALGVNRPPSYEALEGVPCVAGLMDGPVSLVAALLAFGGSSAASLEAQQAGLGQVAAATAVSQKDGPLLEVSPPGMLWLCRCSSMACTHSLLFSGGYSCC